MPTWQHFLTQILTEVTDSRRKFGLNSNGNPNNGREAITKKLLAIFKPFFGTLNKVWALNPTASRLREP